MKKAFERVLIVMFENQYRSYVMQDPFLKKLTVAGADMANYFGAFHPSQTNYIASLAGEVCGVTNDTPPASPLRQRNLVDLLEEGGVSWNAYMEGYPGDPWNPIWREANYPSGDQPLNQFPDGKPELARYFRKHNAFASFQTIQRNQSRWAKIVSDVEFWNDVAGNRLPAYSWFTPDIWNDGHYLYNTHVDTNPRTQLVPQISGWLEYVFFGSIAANAVQGGSRSGQKKLGLHLDIDRLLEDPDAAWKASRVPEGTLIVVTFDEADYDATGYDTNYEGPNQIYTVLLGAGIEPGSVTRTPYNHYSLIKTITRNFDLGDLGKNDCAANWFRFLWGEAFSWSAPCDTGIATRGHLALATLDGVARLVFDSGGELLSASWDGESWTNPESTGIAADGPLAMARLGEALHLVFVKDAEVCCATLKPESGWSAPQSLNVRPSGSLALTAYRDEADQNEKLMLCWRAENGFIRFLVFADGSWQCEPGEVGQLTDGPMALAQMGPSLFLVYKERNTRKMRMTSYNLALFNAFAAVDFQNRPASDNDTSLHAWSPADYPVGHFAKKLAALQNDYRSDGNLAMASIEGEMHLVHRGAYADTPSAFTEFFGLTGVFTATSQRSNGFGTMEQAGWTAEQELPAIQLDNDSQIVLTSDGHKLLLVWRRAGEDGLSFCLGGYSIRP